MVPVKKLPYNFDNFKKLQLEVEELQDLLIKLQAQVAIKETPVKKTPAKKSTTKN